MSNSPLPGPEPYFYRGLVNGIGLVTLVWILIWIAWKWWAS